MSTLHYGTDLCAMRVRQRRNLASWAAIVALLPLAALAQGDSAKAAAPASHRTAAEAASEHPLITAIKRPYSWETVNQFKTVLDATTADLNTIRDAQGKTALHYAARKDDREIATLLMLRGASPDAEDDLGRTPVFDAMEHDDSCLTLLFALRGADFDHVSKEGATPLTLALQKGRARYAEIYLWLGASLRIEGAPASAQPGEVARATQDAALISLMSDYEQLTRQSFAAAPTLIPRFIKDGLQNAANRADFLTLEKLLAAGAPINQADERGKTALHRAIMAGQDEVAFYLLMSGADPNVQDRNGNTPLMQTMGWFGGGLDAMRNYLLLQGANPYAARQDGHTEMSWAAERGNEHGVQWLLWRGISGYERNATFGTPTQIAYRNGSQRVIDLLRRNGVNEKIEKITDPSWNLNNAAKRGDNALIESLLAAGVPPDSMDEKGNSPLMNAIWGRNVDTARLLIKHGASIHFANAKNGETPLYSTMCWDFPALTDFRRELLEGGADPDVYSKREKQTALSRGVWHRPTTPLKQLIEHGADVNLPDPKGQTALSKAIKNGELETAAYLRENGARD